MLTTGTEGQGAQAGVSLPAGSALPITAVYCLVDWKLHEGRDGGLVCHGSPCLAQRRRSRLIADE